MKESLILTAVGLVVLPVHAPAAGLLFSLAFVFAVMEARHALERDVVESPEAAEVEA